MTASELVTGRLARAIQSPFSTAAVVVPWSAWMLQPPACQRFRHGARSARVGSLRVAAPSLASQRGQRGGSAERHGTGFRAAPVGRRCPVPRRWASRDRRRPARGDPDPSTSPGAVTRGREPMRSLSSSISRTSCQINSQALPFVPDGHEMDWITHGNVPMIAWTRPVRSTGARGMTRLIGTGRRYVSGAAWRGNVEAGRPRRSARQQSAADIADARRDEESGQRLLLDAAADRFQRMASLAGDVAPEPAGSAFGVRGGSNTYARRWRRQPSNARSGARDVLFQCPGMSFCNSGEVRV